VNPQDFSGIDLVIIAIVLTMTFLGYRRGFIVGVLSLIGLAVGAVLGTRIGPLILDDGAKSPYNPLFGLVGAGLAGTVLASGLEGMGRKVKEGVENKGIRVFDGLMGCVLSFAVGLGMVWITSAALLHMPAASSSIRPLLQESAIVRELGDRLPASGPILNSLSRIDPLQGYHGPKVLLSAPPPVRPSEPHLRAASRSVVRVVGTSCGLGVTGSGWVIRRGYVVTNAHVVAGQDDTAVQEDGRPPDLDAKIVHFDPDNDLAILEVPELDRPPVRMAQSVKAGTAAAIMGYPLSGPFDVKSARVGATQTMTSENLYNDREFNRRIVIFRGLVRHGNSGGPVVDRMGRVVATVFGGSLGSKQKGGYGVPNSIVTAALRKLKPVGETECTS
jgi:uncharacterized membrane protein required for colicin V production